MIGNIKEVDDRNESGCGSMNMRFFTSITDHLEKTKHPGKKTIKMSSDLEKEIKISHGRGCVTTKKKGILEHKIHDQT